MLILRSFFLGILAALLALVFEIIISFIPGFSFRLLFQQASWILVALVLVEELLKLVFIWKNFSLNKARVSELQIFYQSLFIGLGFALTEATLKFLALLPNEINGQYFYLPILCAILVHICLSGLMGYFIFNAKKLNFLIFLEIMFFSFGWHFLFNFFVIYFFGYWPIAILLISLILFVFLAGYKTTAHQDTYTQ